VVSAGNVTLYWRDNSARETGYALERRTGSETFARYNVVLAPNSQSHTDWSVAPNTTYTYRVRAFNDVGFSEPSNELTITTPGG